jgi:hypothetical protein
VGLVAQGNLLAEIILSGCDDFPVFHIDQIRCFSLLVQVKRGLVDLGHDPGVERPALGQTIELPEA